MKFTSLWSKYYQLKDLIEIFRLVYKMHDLDDMNNFEIFDSALSNLKNQIKEFERSGI